MSGSWDEVNIRRNDVNAYQDASKILTMINMHQSKGSHVIDADGNVMLDLCSTENLPLGHNHEAFISVSRDFELFNLLYLLEHHEQQTLRLFSNQCKLRCIRKSTQ